MVTAKVGNFLADRLPPTKDAADLHSLRVHLQAVFWATLGQTLLPPTEWGWRLRDGRLQPAVAMTQHQDLLI